jgi:heterodisulfide reductase subunit A
VAIEDEKAKKSSINRMVSSLRMAVADLEDRDPKSAPTVPVVQRALVVGGGISGMHAALAIADLGFPADLVEKGEQLGGNLLWLKRTIDGLDVGELLKETVSRVEKHPNITVHTGTQVASAFGQAGHFFTALENRDGQTTNIEHGVAILATGGSEAVTASYGKGQNPKVITQSELEKKLSDGSVEAEKLKTVAMIQCVDSREEPRNFCSRVCCATALKNALFMKKKNPDINICILYRDMMAYGFAEKYFTEARKRGVMFFAYDREKKPSVQAEGDGTTTVKVDDRILGRPVEIEADLVVLASGVSPDLSDSLTTAYGVKKDQDGFFEEAESKWRPVDAMKEGVFACGLALSPRSIPESIASAQAAAQRALRIISRKSVPAGRNVAKVRTSLCSLCERCIDACPYEARSLSVEEDKIVVNPVMCQGCGACATVCPNDASYLEGFQARRMLDVIDEAFYAIK